VRSDPELEREMLEAVDGLEWVAGNDEAHVGHLGSDPGKGSQQDVEPFCRAQEAEVEQGAPVRRAELVRGAREQRVRDARDALGRDAELRQPFHGRRAVDHHPVDGREDRPPELQPPLGAPGQDVVRGEDEAAPARQPPQPETVDVRDAEPLHVHDLGVEVGDLAVGPDEVREVLETLDCEPGARPRPTRKQSCADGEEEVMPPEADRLGSRSVRECCGNQVDLVTPPRERGG
jgi:hypothetical protein